MDIVYKFKKNVFVLKSLKISTFSECWKIWKMYKFRTGDVVPRCSGEMELR